MIPRGLCLCVLPLLATTACREVWEPEAAIRPGLEALDSDDDSTLSAAELQQGSPGPSPIANWDADASGGLDSAELLAMVRGNDPLSFDGVVAAATPDPSDGKLVFPYPHQVRSIRALFRFMAGQVRQAQPSASPPSEAAIEAAAQTGSINSPESLAVAAELVRLYEAAGLTAPPSMLLRAEAHSP